MASDLTEPAPDDLTEEQKHANVVRLAFGGDEDRFRAFCDTLRASIPQGTGVVLRGSAITGRRWKTGEPFDHAGPGTSDLDVTLVGEEAVGLFKITGFYVPGVHSRPVSEKAPEIAPELVPLREKLMAIAGRPVNIQASRDVVMQFRGDLLGQPYLVLVSKPDLETPLGLQS